MLGVFGLSRVRFFSSRKTMQAMMATVAMETPTPTPIAVLLLRDVCVVAAALWVDAEGTLVPESVDAGETKVAKVVLPEFRAVDPVAAEMPTAALLVGEVVAWAELALLCALEPLVEAASWEEEGAFVDAAACSVVEAVAVDEAAAPPQVVCVAAEVVEN
jgi:hypothetical protein